MRINKWMDGLVENRDFFHTPLAFDAPVRGVPVGAVPRIRYGKTRMVYIATGWWKKIEDTFIRLDMIHERDNRHAHRHRMTA